MDKRVTPPKRVSSLTWGPPPPCKQALSGRSRGEAQGACSAPPSPVFRQNQICQGKKNYVFTEYSSHLHVWMSPPPPPPPPLKVVREANGAFPHPIHPSILHLFLGDPCE